MVHIMNSTGKDGSKDLKVCEDSLEGKRPAQRGRRSESNHWTKISLQVRALIEADCERVGLYSMCVCVCVPLGRGWIAAHELTV